MLFNWKIYELHLEKWQSQICYILDGEAILVNDTVRLAPPFTSFIWDGKNKDRTRGVTPPTRITCPTELVPKEYFEEYVKEEILLGLIKSYGRDESYADHNIILLQKDWGEMIEIGSALCKAITNQPSIHFQEMFDRYVALIPFS